MKTDKPQPLVRAEKRVGRNDPCICGSGKKWVVSSLRSSVNNKINLSILSHVMIIENKIFGDRAKQFRIINYEKFER